MTFKESSAKNKHSVVSSGARLLLLTTVVGANRIISCYFDSHQESKIRTRNIRIRSIERRAFCVTLDKDPRRTYRDVQR